MRALRILPAATLALLAAVAAAQAQRIAPSISRPSVSGGGGGGFTPQNRHPSFYFNPKEMTLEKGKPWTDKNKKHPGPGSGHCQPPNC